MNKPRKYLKDLIPVNVNELVLTTGYYELQIGDKLLSLAPDRCPDGSYVISLFVNHLRQPKVWALSARPHNGRLQRGGHIPYANDEVYYVASGSRRFRHLFVCPETMMIGTRTDFFRTRTTPIRAARPGRQTSPSRNNVGRWKRSCSPRREMRLLAGMKITSGWEGSKELSGGFQHVAEVMLLCSFLGCF